MKRLSCIFLVLVYSTLLSVLIAQTAENDTKVNWMTWEEAIERSKIEKRKVFVTLYKDHCEWSKHMENNTYNQAHIAQYLNEQFYPVRFNASQKASIQVANKTYKQVRKSGEVYHEFTAFITMGRMSTPTIVFFDENLRLLQPIAGYKSPQDFEMIMTYYSEDFYRQIPWSRYHQIYVPMNVKGQTVKKN